MARRLLLGALLAALAARAGSQAGAQWEPEHQSASSAAQLAALRTELAQCQASLARFEEAGAGGYAAAAGRRDRPGPPRPHARTPCARANLRAARVMTTRSWPAERLGGAQARHESPVPSVRAGSGSARGDRRADAEAVAADVLRAAYATRPAGATTPNERERVVQELVRRLEVGALHQMEEAARLLEELKVEEGLSEYAPDFHQGYAICDDNYPWWRDAGAHERMACLAGLLSIEQPWECGDSSSPHNCYHSSDPAMYTPAPEVAGGGLEGEGEGDMWWDSEGSVGLEGRVMVGVASADGEMFRQRLTMLSSLLASLRVSAVYAKAVARDMVAEGGPLEVCRPVRPGEEGLPDSYFANGLNQLQLMLRAWRDGYSHVLVLEDDVALAPQFANVAYARQVLREVAAEAPREYDIVFLGDCCDIAAKDRPAQAAAARVGSWLIRTERASRCSNAYLISRRGMQKMLVHVPAWCSLDWMMNAAKYAVAAPALQTQVYMMEPPMFVEGSKTGTVMTTVEPGSPFGPPL